MTSFVLSSALLLVPLLGAPEESAAALQQKALHLASQGRLEESITALEAALRRSPGSPDLLNDLGVLLRRRGHTARAIATFQLAIRSRPHDYRIHSNLSLALKDAGKLDESVAAMRHACSLTKDETCRRALAQLELAVGRASEAGGQIDNAVTAYKRSVEADPKCGVCAGGLSAALLKAGDTDGAVAVLRTAVGLLPDEAAVHADLGLALARTGNHAEALPHLERAVALDPDHAAARYALARELQRTGRREEARAHLGKAKASGDKSKRVMMARAFVNAGADHLRAGRTADAVSSLGRAVELDPANANARHNLGVALLAASRFEDALREFEAALASDPRRADTLYYAGRARLTLGDATRAASDLKKATELKPDDAWAWNALAVAYSMSEDAAQAAAAMDRAVALDGRNELFQRNRECLRKMLDGCRLIH